MRFKIFDDDMKSLKDKMELILERDKIKYSQLRKSEQAALTKAKKVVEENN